MRTIAPMSAVNGKEYVIVEEATGYIYGRYADADTAERICNDLLKRYGDDTYFAAHVEEQTCDADETDRLDIVFDSWSNYGKRAVLHVMECTECGGTYEHVNGDYEYCPRCGRRRVAHDVD